MHPRILTSMSRKLGHESCRRNAISGIKETSLSSRRKIGRDEIPSIIQDLWVNQNHYMERKLGRKATADALIVT